MKHCFKSLLILILLISSHTLTARIFDAHLTQSRSWYPKLPKKLLELLQQLSNNARESFAMKTDSAQIRAIVAPHAAYIYSGKVAFAAYNLLDSKKVDHVIILGPSHAMHFEGIALPTFGQYRTPLGTLTVNSFATERIKKHPLVVSGDQYFKPEHSIEMQLPLIQRSTPKAKITPIVVGHLSDAQVKEVASLLKTYITKKTIVVVSSDFTHYGENFNYMPFTNHVLLNINQLDSSILNPIQHQDRAAFENIIATTHDTMCGYQPERILLELIQQDAFGPVTTRLVAHGTSSEVSHDEKSVVSYASLIVTNELDNDVLNKQEQTSLLTYARNTLQQSFKPTMSPDLLKPIQTLLLEKPHGAFTTLWTPQRNGERTLRGCIGQVHSDKPLYEVVALTALDSAFHDSRFSPVNATELPRLKIQISVLKEPKPIATFNEIILHKHGIILSNSNKSALFLPTVPAEFGYDLSQTLEQLSLKAGLEKEAWKLPSTTYKVFEAQDFEE